jgi:hypothetical protein
MATNGSKLGDQYLRVPVGGNAEQPADVDSTVGMVRFNDDLDALENYTDAAGWIKVSVQIPNVTSVTGTIYNTVATDLAINGTSFGGSSQVTIAWYVNGSQVTTSTETSNASGTEITGVGVPSAVYNSSAGSTVTITVQNTDGGLSGQTAAGTILGVPSGGSVTSSGSTRTHIFTSSGTFTVPSGVSITAEALVVGGGGAGGYHYGDQDTGAGGGGAGGVLYTSSKALTAGSYSITVGNGGAGRSNGNNVNPPGAPNGQNSSAFGVTANGGGGGASSDSHADAKTGGSGGGGASRGTNYNEIGKPSNQPSYSGWSAYGNGGGNSFGDNAGGGGGGGAGGSGANQNGQVGGAGGAGRNYSAEFGTGFGESGSVGGGGGGGSYGSNFLPSQSAGGSGGGGNGVAGRESNNVGSANGYGQQYRDDQPDGIANSGGGGGGSSEDGQDTNGNQSGGGSQSGAGGSGVVVIKYTL